MLIMLNTQEEKSIGKGDRIAEQQKKRNEIFKTQIQKKRKERNHYAKHKTKVCRDKQWETDQRVD